VEVVKPHMALVPAIMAIAGCSVFVLASSRLLLSQGNPFVRHSISGGVSAAIKRLRRAPAWLSGGTTVNKDLSYAIELLNLCSMSGMSIVQAFETVGRSGQGRVYESFEKAAHDFAAGISRNEVLERLRIRIGGPAMFSLVSSLRRADENGTPLAQVLHAQAENARKLELAERMKAIELVPLFIVIVTVTLLLPTIVLVTMVPHLLVFMKTAW